MAQKKILVVEDERAIREMLAFNLGRAGYEVRPAGDGREARAAIADGQPDLVLMDWMLPDVSGLELTRQLKRDPHTREIPVIMLTARVEEDDRVAGLDGGADDYIVKPFSQRELLARIRAALRRSIVAEGEVVTVGRAQARRREPPGQRRGCGESRSDRPNIGCSSSSCITRTASTAARSCSTESGAATCTSKSARSTCTSGGCARRSRPTDTIN